MHSAWIRWAFMAVLFLMAGWSAYALQSPSASADPGAYRPSGSGASTGPVNQPADQTPTPSALQVPQTVQKQMATITGPYDDDVNVPALNPGDRISVTGNDMMIWKVTGNDTYLSIRTSRYLNDADPVLVIYDESGNDRGVYDDCDGVNLFPCVRQRFLAKGETYYLAVYDQVLPVLSVTIERMHVAPIPKKVTGLAVPDVTSSSMQLSWSDSNDPSIIQSYRVERDVNTDPYDTEAVWKPYALTNEPRLLISGLKPQIQEQFRVVAIGKEGMHSQPSLPVSAWTNGVLTYNRETANPAGNTIYELTGNGERSRIHYLNDVYSYDNVPDMELIGPTGQVLTEFKGRNVSFQELYMDTPLLETGKTYLLKLTYPGRSAWYGRLKVELLDGAPPSAPQNLKVETVKTLGGNYNFLSWELSVDDRPGKIVYEIERNGELPASLKTMDQKYMWDDTVEKGMTYTYRVRAVDGTKNRSDWSLPVTVKMPYAPHYVIYVPDRMFTSPELVIKTDSTVGLYRLQQIKPSDPQPEMPGYHRFDFDLAYDFAINSLQILNGSLFPGDSMSLSFPDSMIKLSEGTYYVKGGMLIRGTPHADVTETVIYYPVDHSVPADQAVYMHFRKKVGGWTQAPGMRMVRTEDNRFYKVTIDTYATEYIAEAAFFTERNQWDNRNGLNYSFDRGTWTVWKGALLKGKPSDYNLIPQDAVIRYCGLLSGEPVYVHYRTDLTPWTNAPGVLLPVEPGNSTCRLMQLKFEGNQQRIQEAAFYLPWRNKWNNNSGRNYMFHGGRSYFQE